MLYREIIAACSEIHTKHINTLCGQNVELFSVKPGSRYSKQQACARSKRTKVSKTTNLSSSRNFTHFMVTLEFITCTK
jgi:hypothetical protein